MGINHLKKRGFTLIELVVVIGVVGLTLPALFTIMFAVLQQQVKIIHLSETKRQGDAVLSKFESGVRNNAVSIHITAPPGNQVCDINTPSSPPGIKYLYFAEKLSGQWFGFTGDDSIDKKIVYSTPTGNTDLTSSKVLVENFNIGCSFGQAFTEPVVSISFDICYNSNGSSFSCTGGNQADIIPLHYSSTVRLRNQ